MSQRLVVIGGGAAGFFCAVNAARLQPGLEVIIAEKGSKVLSKVRISGGGRCNVTHGRGGGKPNPEPPVFEERKNMLHARHHHTAGAYLLDGLAYDGRLGFRGMLK